MKYYTIPGSKFVYEGNVSSVSHKVTVVHKKNGAGVWTAKENTNASIELKVNKAFKEGLLKEFITLESAKASLK